jgi:hypothetical protein
MPTFPDLADLQFSEPITNPDGTASDYFLRYLRDRGGFFSEAEQAIADILARQIIAGAGLTDGGTLDTDVTLNVGAGTGITVNADDVAIDTTAEAERIRDVIGTTLTEGANITITVDDGADTITIAASGGGGGTSATLYTLSADSAVDIVLGSGEVYEIDYYLVPSADGVTLDGQVTNDSFSTVETGSNYAYIDYRQGTGGTATSSSDSATNMIFQNPVGNAAGEHCAGTIKVLGSADSGTYTGFSGQGTRINSSGQQNMDNSAATYKVAEAIDGLRLSFSSGTMTGWVVVREVVGT